MHHGESSLDSESPFPSHSVSVSSCCPSLRDGLLVDMIGMEHECLLRDYGV
jgi:hypothetical protein